jgi:hypothetical protein
MVQIFFVGLSTITETPTEPLHLFNVSQVIEMSASMLRLRKGERYKKAKDFKPIVRESVLGYLLGTRNAASPRGSTASSCPRTS